MTRQAEFKRRVRARMAKTGESYAAARSQLLGERPVYAEDWMATALHITNGDCTDVRGTGLAQRIMVWRDVLHEGPVPAVAYEQLRRIRAAFLADAAGGEEYALGFFSERDETLAANRYGEYVLWFEADLYDQLQIVEILVRLAELAVPAERITLICIGEHPGIAHFGGLGELRPEQLRELPATKACARLTPADAADTSAEHVFTRAWSREARPYLGDTWSFATMDRLAKATHPLLDARPTGAPVDRSTRLRLTETGALVLAGAADHVALNGIDRWIGGVHLTGHDVRWRWDEGTETLTGSVKRKGA